MLRQAVVRRHLIQGGLRRWMMAAAATKKQKRALDQQQLKGGGKPPPPPPPTLAPPPTAAATPPPSQSGGSNMIPIAVVGLAVVGGAAYYFNSLQSTSEEKSTIETKDDAISEPQESTARSLPVGEEPRETTKEERSSDNRVVSIQIPSKMRNTSSETVTAPDHPPDGHRVSMNVEKAPPLGDGSITEKAIQDLKEKTDEQAAEALVQSHQSLLTSMDESFFADLDSLNNAQLKARVVQLATEMKDRTKWEAVRLKEFLAMKEKETADQYMQILQKQRLEFEDLLAKRLREQEYALSQQMQNALQEKEANIQNVLKTALEAQQHEHEQDKLAFEESKSAEIQSKLEDEYGQKMEAYKSEVAQDLQQKVATLEVSSEKLKQLESALEASQTSQKGSLKAHRISAAALAFAEKLETSRSASTELKTLKKAAGKEGVISTALKTLPKSVETGTPTLSELQTRFEDVHKKCRQAALVPAGRPGLDGQLAGMVFATIKYPPDPEDPAPEDDKDNAEYVLVRARKHVQLGELEKAVEQLDKLKGQPAFTVADWKKDAMDRITVEKALKAIKLECALLNSSLSE